MSEINSESVNPGEPLFPWPIVEKSLPRPAPTESYSWSKYNPKAQIHYLTDHNRTNSLLESTISDNTVLGFDIEWRPNYIKGCPENPVSLIQLANNDAIFLLQISSMREFPLVLADVLANPSIVKTGVGIQNDAAKLYNDCRVNMSNCVDLSLLAKTVDNQRWQGKYNCSLGLSRLVESYEYLLLEKGRITRSNWEASLIPAQIEYASNDAHAAYVLHERLSEMKLLLSVPPEPKWFTFNLINGRLCNPDGTDWHVYNPMYNPGPPPPPKAPRPPKQKDDVTTPLDGKPSEIHTQAPSASREGKRKPNRPSGPSYKDYDSLVQIQSSATHTPPRVPRSRGENRPRASTSAQRGRPNVPNVGSSSHSQVADSNTQFNSTIPGPSGPRSSLEASPNRNMHFKRPSVSRYNVPSDDPHATGFAKPTTRPQREPSDSNAQGGPRPHKARRPHKPRPTQPPNPGHQPS